MELIGTLIGMVAERLVDFSRASIAKAMRDVADRVEAGDFVSDAALAKLEAANQRVRRARERLAQQRQ